MIALLSCLLLLVAPLPSPGADSPAISAAAPASEAVPVSSNPEFTESREPPTPREAAEAFCAAVLDGDADAAAESLASPQPLWTTMDEFQAFIDANGLALLGRPWRVSGEAGLGETRCRLWITTNDDDPAHTFSLILVRMPGSDWRIREVDGYDVATALPAESQTQGSTPIILSEAERAELDAAYENALSRGAFADAFDAGYRLWQGGVLSHDDVNRVLNRWQMSARNGAGDMTGFEERAAQLHEAVRDDSTPVRWRMYPDRAYSLPLNLKSSYEYHERMAGLAQARQDPANLYRHRRQALDALIQAYGFAKDRPAKVYLLDTAVPYYRHVARGGADDSVTPQEKRLYQATLLQHARSVLPRAPREPRASSGKADAARAAPVQPRSPVAPADAFRLLHEEHQRFREQSAQRAATRRASP